METKIKGDEAKWRYATEDELVSAAKVWAKKYTLQTLCAFQEDYSEKMAKLKDDFDHWKAMQNRWQSVTWAISYKAFGVI